MNYPIAFYLCGLLIAGLVAEALSKLRFPWAISAVVVYLTTFAWYFVDLYQSPDAYQEFSTATITKAYLEVAIFLLVFRWSLPKLSNLLSPKPGDLDLSNRAPSPEILFVLLACFWLILLTIGVGRMKWDFMGALFPLDGRAGDTMFSRGALGDSYDFLVSSGGYLYQLVCGLLGVVLVLQRNILGKVLNAAIFLISLPYFLLSGTRSIFLAAIAPLFLTYLLMGRQKVLIRLLILAMSFLAVNSVLLVVIENRNTGFRFLFDEEVNKQKEFQKEESNAAAPAEWAQNEKKATHEGLNMIQELCYINEFNDTGIFQPDWGVSFLVQLANFIPRAIWADKPKIGIDYAIWRGFGTSDNALGVAATVTTGMIGSGIMNFGIWLGPAASGIILALWGGLLTRWWQQRKSILRLCLFMAGLGLTFNLGRDITLLVLWPVVFAYALVRLFDFFFVCCENYPKHFQIQKKPEKASVSHQ